MKPKFPRSSLTSPVSFRGSVTVTHKSSVAGSRVDLRRHGVTAIGSLRLFCKLIKCIVYD